MIDVVVGDRIEAPEWFGKNGQIVNVPSTNGNWV